MSSKSSNSQVSNRSVEYKVKASRYPLFLAKQITLSNRKQTRLIVTASMDGPVSIVEYNSDSLTEWSTFIPCFPISTFYFDRENNHLYCGDICGNVVAYPIQEKAIWDLKYTNNEEFNQKDIKRQPLIMVHKRLNKLYMMNLMNEFKIYNMSEAKLEKVIPFRASVTASLMFQDKTNNQFFLAIAFHNGRPPYLFNFQTNIDTTNEVDTLDRYYTQEEQFSSEILDICYSPEQNTLVCSDRSGNISIYGIKRLDQRCSAAALKWKIRTDGLILHLNLEQNMMCYVQSKKIQVLDLQAKKRLYNFQRNYELRWSLPLKRYKDGLQQKIDLIIIRGYNPFQKPQYKEKVSTIHLIHGNVRNES